MALLSEIINYLDAYLDADKMPDSSQNGLQVLGAGEVRRAAFAVSANKYTFDEAFKRGADLIITHHGLIWDKPVRLTGVNKKRFEVLIKNNISLAAWHLPLDRHPVVGNNIAVCKKLGLKKVEPFGLYKGALIGFKGVLPAAKNVREIEKILTGANTVFDFAGKKVESVAVVSGGAHGHYLEAIDQNIDLFITGTSDEWITEMARESGAAFMALGHYKSEMGGVQNLQKLIDKKFKIETFFIETGNKL